MIACFLPSNTRAGKYLADKLQSMIISGCITSATISAALPFGHLIIGTVPERKQ